MSDLNRDEIKYVRDISKSAYKKEFECYICGTNDTLYSHSYNTASIGE